MSHYTVLVIGDDPENQLEPFNENTEAEAEAYVKETVSEEDKKSFMEFYLEKGKISPDVSFDEAVALCGNDWNGNRWQKNDAGVWEDWSTYNPDSKWDWYSLGGRWRGYFKLKQSALQSPELIGEPGAFDNEPRYNADQCLKGDVDFEFMRNVAVNKAAGQYDRLHAIVQGREIPVWDKIREKHPDNIEAARKEYREHPVIRDLKAVEEFHDLFIWDDEPSRFAESRTDFIQKARNSAITTYALLYKGIWYAKGEMGWWGMSNDKMSDDEWNKQFNELLDSLPDDTLLSLYDCHI